MPGTGTASFAIPATPPVTTADFTPGAADFTSDPIDVAPATIDIMPVMSATAAAAAAAATTVISNQELVASVSPDVLVTDTALDIDDSEDDEYYDEDYSTKRERMSSPLFILIVFLVLIIQVVFVGWLVSTGFIDMSSCSSPLNN
jgi:hypothetical protein